jgi:simple sugar transport system ATP-binding protein
MRQGRVVAERMAAETDIAELAMLMVGHPLASYEIDPPKPGATLLETKGLRLVDEGREVLSDISLHVNAGEIVGIAGVSGNGQSELIRCITGLEKATGGQVLVGGKDVTNRSVREVRDAGLAHISEDRYVWGSAPEGTLEENALMARQDEAPFSRHGIIHPRAIRDYAAKLIQGFNVKASSTTQKMRELSGGNAQKLIVAREMSLDTPVLICCEPTRGIDVGAMEAIHSRMLQRRDAGAAILLVSSELTEIMSLSDRIYVIFEGRIVGEFQRGSMDDRRLGILMVGGSIGHEQ